MKQLLPILCVLIIGSCSSKEAALNFICESDTLSNQYTLRINLQSKTMHFISASAKYKDSGWTLNKNFIDDEDRVTASNSDVTSSLLSLSFNKFSGVVYENFTWGSIKYQCRKIESLM